MKHRIQLRATSYIQVEYLNDNEVKVETYNAQAPLVWNGAFKDRVFYFEVGFWGRLLGHRRIEDLPEYLTSEIERMTVLSHQPRPEREAHVQRVVRNVEARRTR